MVGPSGRNDFTKRDDEHLVAYIAKEKPTTSGRLGNNLYKTLEENAGNRWPWSKNHSWQSWRERYKKNQEYFDQKIRRYQKGQRKEPESSKDVTKKLAKPAEDAPLAKPNATSTVTEKKPQVEKPSMENVSADSVLVQLEEKTEKAKSRNVAASKAASVARRREENTHEEVRDSQEQDQEEAGSKPVGSDNYMHDLFGSYDEEENAEDFQKPPASSSPQSPNENIYPNLGDVPVPTLNTAEVHVPGAFDVVVQHLSQEPTPPKSGAENSNFEKSPQPLVQPTQQKKLKKRKTDEDPFGTPPTTPPPTSAVGPRRKLPTLVEGPFHTALKRKRTAPEDTAEGDRPWPPKRSKAEAEMNHIQGLETLKQPTMAKPALHMPDQPVPPRQPPQVNAVASSSKVKLPDARTNHFKQTAVIESALVRESSPHSLLQHTGPSTNPISRNAQAQSKLTQNAKERRKNDLPTNHSPELRQGIDKDFQKDLSKSSETPAPIPTSEAKFPPYATLPSNPLAALTSTGSNHTLPTRPSLDNDPFTSIHILEKAAGKTRAEQLYVLENKPPRRIDLHRQSLTKRPRASNSFTSFPSRPNSVLSSRTSTSSESNKIKKPRRSGSLRRSIAELSPEESKKFAYAAAQEIASVIEEMANTYGVSEKIAMKTYAMTGSMEKTKIVLQELYKGLSKLEEDIYSRLPGLLRNSDEEAELEDDDDIPGGLIPHVSSGKKGNSHSPQRRQQHSTSPRRSRPSLTVKPLLPDDTLSDYSPPNSSRAGQFARLMRQGRKEEALEREKRRASGVFVPHSQAQAQAQQSPPFPPADTSPSPQDRQVSPEVDRKDEDDDMYLRTDDEQHETDDEQHEADEAKRLEPEEGQEELAFLPYSQTLSKRILEEERYQTVLAQEHRTLALDVDAENADRMRQFEAENPPGFLRLMSIKWVNEILEAYAQGYDMEEDRREVDEPSDVE